MNCMRRMSCTSCVRGNICMSWIVCKRCTSLMNCMNRMGDILLKRLKRRRQTPLHATHRSLRLPMSANKPSGRDDREFSPRVLRARNDQKQYKPRAEQKEGNAKKRISRKESLEATEAGGSRKNVSERLRATRTSERLRNLSAASDYILERRGIPRHVIVNRHAPTIRFNDREVQS